MIGLRGRIRRWSERHVALNPRTIVSSQEAAAIKSALAEFYRDRPPAYAKSIPTRDYGRYAAVIARHARFGARVLDLGPGSEASPLALYSHGFDVDACDVWEESTMRAHAAKLPHPGPRLAAYDGERLPYPDTCFDVVASMAVLEHILDPGGFLVEADRVLKPGGLQVHLAPNWSGPHVVVHAAANLVRGHGRYWQYTTWADVLAGVIRTLCWPVGARFGRRPFILVRPRMQGDHIHFERSDDDCVHLCCPPSLWRWFADHQYSVISRTDGTGHLWLGRLVNRLAPAVATSNAVVARKWSASSGKP